MKCDLNMVFNIIMPCVLHRESPFPVSHRLFPGTAEWCAGVWHCGGVSSREAGKASDGLLWYGDRRRRVDGTMSYYQWVTLHLLQLTEPVLTKSYVFKTWCQSCSWLVMKSYTTVCIENKTLDFFITALKMYSVLFIKMIYKLFVWIALMSFLFDSSNTLDIYPPKILLRDSSSVFTLRGMTLIKQPCYYLVCLCI